MWRFLWSSLKPGIRRAGGGVYCLDSTGVTKARYNTMDHKGTRGMMPWPGYLKFMTMGKSTDHGPYHCL